MNTREFTYFKRSENNREMVRFVISDLRSSNVVTYTVFADMLLCGIYHCYDEANKMLEMPPKLCLKVLRFIREERDKSTCEKIKSLANWLNSGLPDFEDYCKPGDTVSGDIVEHFVNCCPPCTCLSSCTQVGEVYSCEADSDGTYHNTYITFHQIDSTNWMFDGYCYLNENENKVNNYSKLSRLIEKIMQELQISEGKGL